MKTFNAYRIGKMTICDTYFGWSISGLIPFDSVMRFYRTAAGRDSFEAFSPGCHPQDFIEWILPSGQEIFPESTRDEIRSRLNGNERLLDEMVFSDTPEAIGGSPYLTELHIYRYDVLHEFMQLVDFQF